LVAIRDFAPYAYAMAAPLTFLAAVPKDRRLRAWIYGALTFHALWYAAATSGAINAANTWQISPGATLFSTRPDFDSAVFGIALGFSVHQLAFGPRPRSPVPLTALSAFIALNGYELARQHSRSGLLSAILSVAAVVGAWLIRPRADSTPARHAWSARGSVAAGALAAATLALLFTLPGQRLVRGLESHDSQASGTSHARTLVSEGVTHWLLRSPVLTTFGVGYGPNILARSGTVQYLEGTEFTNVRSPHDYLLGTWARLGLIGAGMAAAIFLAAGRLAIRQLATASDPADVLAALTVIALPVVALFGVVLESPFGAIPYFWAVGQLCATARRRGRPAPVAAESPLSAGAER
jgi:O-antigen ligase